MSSAEAASRRDIAIVGMACLFPGAEGPEAFWRNICAKSDQIGQPVPGWGAERYLNGTSHTRITTAAGGFLGELYRFDPAELGVMPSSVDGSEPDQFLALKAARDALADAGYLDHHDHVKTGIVLGHSTYLHRGNATVVQHGIVIDQFVSLLRQLLPDAPEAALTRLQAALVDRLPAFNADTAPGLVPNVMTGRIANKLDLRGPNYLIDAACASSLLAVQTAMEELRTGRSDMMLAGGVNASLPAEVYMVFTQLGALSRRGKVRPFDADSDGTLLGEGLGIVALKRLDDAVAAGDRVYAVLKAVGQASDGRGAGLLAPRLEGEILAIRRAFAQTDILPETIGLIEAHGTGIPLGDRTEIEALREVFGERLADCPRIALGGVKSMIGHCIPAAGMAGMIKTALALHYRTLPPTLCDAPRPDLGLDNTPLYLNTELRPWISPRGTKRRAAINAFGFGGINSHAILEEAPEPERAPRPAHLPAELIVLAAETPAALAEKVCRLQKALAGPLADVPLSAVAAASVVRDGASGPARLAIVATSTVELVDRLAKARERLAGGRANFQVRSGIYGADRVSGGKIAFVFPGEGAQYQGMLADLLIAFPEARRWFDCWDGLYGAARAFHPSDSVFPPPTTLGAKAAARLRQELFGLEMGSESAFIGCQALLAVTQRVGLQPDAVLGHSSGEHAALRAAGVFGGDGWETLEEQIRELNRLYKNIETEATVPGGALLTVGAVPREKALALAEGNGIHLALDNCREQTVLYGPRQTLETIARDLGREGGLCAFLPFDRPYHTPLFAPIAAMVERVYAGMRFAAPKLPIYSCATAAAMPSDPDAIRSLAAEQWRSRVRFTETIERMYDDGFRTFVEVGPSANLTGFIENILQGRDVLAVALDSRRRSSLVQLLQAAGRIWAAGHKLDPTTLTADRPIPIVDLDAAEPPRTRARPFSNTLPFVQLSDTEIAELSQALRPGRDASATPPPPEASADAALVLDAEAKPVTEQVSEPVWEEMPRVHRPEMASAMTGHFALMQQFLDMQGAVMTAALADSEPGQSYPFLHRILVQNTDNLVAECDVDVSRDEFLRHHVLYATEVSDLDPDLMALPVVPLAVSIEMMAEAAAVLTGGLTPIRLEKVRAFNWIALDDGRSILRLEARRLHTGSETRVSVKIIDQAEQPALDAEIVLVETAPPAPAGAAPPLSSPRAPVWKDEDLYTTGMFHGPLFHSIASLQAWDESGLDAVLAHTPLHGFIAPGDRPSLLINPVLLDAVGHVTAFWIAQHLGTDFSSFPSGIDRIELFEAWREDTAGGVISGRLGFETGEHGGRFLRGDFTCTSAEGRLLFRATGWRDRFFDVPHRFYFARWSPRDGFYGEETTGLFAALPKDSLVWAVPAFPRGFLDDAGSIWRRVLVHTLLSAEERAYWSTMPGPTRRRDDWLVGRIALKEAARSWIERHRGIRLLPADLVVRTTEAGKPYLAADGLEALGEMPEVSVAHVEGEAVAVAAPPGVAVGVDFERIARVELTDLLSAGFSERERSALFGANSGASRVLQAWCAKEAAAKCLGTGFEGQPHRFVVTGLSESGQARVETEDCTIDVVLAASDSSVVAVACASGVVQRPEELLRFR